jgi:hypothetical protein
VIGKQSMTFFFEATGKSSWGPLFDGVGKAESGEVRMEVVEDEIEEIYGAAAHVHDMIVSGRYRSNDIAVVTNDKHRYETMLRAAFAQRGVPLNTGRPGQGVFRNFVHALLTLIESPHDSVALQALVTSPFYGYFRSSCLGTQKPMTEPASEMVEVQRLLESESVALRDGKPAAEHMRTVIDKWLRPACEPYGRETEDESIYGFLSTMTQRWQQYTAASEDTGRRPTMSAFVRVSELFSTVTASPMPSTHEVGFYSSREVKGRFFRAVLVIGCSELLFPSAMKRESVMPVSALQKMLDDTVPDLRVRVYGARTPLDHLHEQYHQLYQSLTRAEKTLYLSAPRMFAGHIHPAPAAILDETLPQPVREQTSYKQRTPPQIRFARKWVREPETPPLAERLQELSPFGQQWNVTSPDPQSFALDRFPLSKSSLQRYLECPRYFFYEKALRIPEEESNAIRVGKVFHDVMKKIGETFSSKAALHTGATETFVEEAIEEATREAEIPPNTLFATSLRFHLKSMVRGALHLDEKDSDDYTIESVESELKYAHDGWDFSGRIDRLDHTAGGAVVIDYKSGKFNKTASNLRDKTLDSLEKPDRANWQVPIYAWGHRQTTGQLPDAFKHLVQMPGEDPFSITLYIRQRDEEIPLTALSNKTDYQAFSYLLEREIQEIMDRAARHAKEIFSARVRFEKTDRIQHCRTCTFNRLCNRRTE